jgi:putative restriction endonuclease
MSGEGQRILNECFERLRARSDARGGVGGSGFGGVTTPAPALSPEILVAAEAARRGKPILVQPRLGQGTFRLSVVSAYDGACAVTSEHSLPVLEAAHVQPFAQGGPHDVNNGLLLRSDVHRLFDLGYVTVSPEYRFRVSSRLMDDYHNGREYERFEGRQIRLPHTPELQPSRELLDWHGQVVFRG